MLKVSTAIRSLRNYLVGTLLVLIVLELVLRSLGFVLTFPLSRRNQISPDDQNKIRILAIGESTTADFFAEDNLGAWPRQLEKKLLDNGISARVYNEGVGGTSTPLILARLPRYLEQYQPQVVVSMMGTNDYSLYYYGDVDENNLQNSFYNFRVVKLYRIMRERLDRSLHCKFDEGDVIQPEFRQLIFEWVEKSKNMTPEAVIEDLSTQIPNKKDLARVLAAVYQERQNQENFSGKNMPSRLLIFKAFELYPLHHSIAYWVFGQLSPEECQAYGEQVFKCGPNVPDDIKTQYLQCSEKKADFATAAGRRLGLRIENSNTQATRQNYQALNRILVTHQIDHIAVQYPTLPVSELKNYFLDPQGQPIAEFQNIHFVSNEDNFKTKLRNLGYDKLFVDRFKGSWGHSTTLGHQLIAEQVYLELKKGLLHKLGAPVSTQPKQ